MLTNSEMKKLNEEITISIQHIVVSLRRACDISVAEMTENLSELQNSLIIEIDKEIYKAEVLNEFSKRISGYINSIYLEYYDPDSEN